MPESSKLEDLVEFANNPEPRCACVLLLDTSGSMFGDPINALNEGLRTFKENLKQDSLAKKRIEVAIVTFDSNVNIVQDFVTAEQFQPPTLTAGGSTHTGSGINIALDMIQNRKSKYRANGISYYRPWVFMITDGEPTESDQIVAQGAQRIKEEEARKGVAFFAVGVEGANMSRLSQIVARTPLKLKGLNFQELFLWLSVSMQSISQSKTDEQVPLQSPAGWAQV